MSQAPPNSHPEMIELPGSDLARLPKDLAIIKMENDSMMAAAIARPRDYKAILADLKAQVDTYKTFAQSAIYNKPVGKNEQGKMTYARGLSIRAAEAIAEAYGFCRIREDIIPIDHDTVRIEATFVDYQKGRTWQSAGIVSKTYRRRKGGMGRYDDDRFYNVVCKAEASKRIREVILRSVPAGLKSDLEEAVDRQLDEYLDDATTKKIVSQFSQKGVSAEQLETHLGKNQANWNKGDRKTLVGLWTGIQDGEVNVAELFGEQPANGEQATRTETVAQAVEQAFEQKGLKPGAASGESSLAEEAGWDEERQTLVQMLAKQQESSEQAASNALDRHAKRIFNRGFAQLQEVGLAAMRSAIEKEQIRVPGKRPAEQAGE